MTEQQNNTVTLMHGPDAYQVNADGAAYLINPYDDSVRDLKLDRCANGDWCLWKSKAPVESGLSSALEEAWQGMQ